MNFVKMKSLTKLQQPLTEPCLLFLEGDPDFWFIAGPVFHGDADVFDSTPPIVPANMVWYSYGHMLNAVSVLVSSLAYNRDTFADSTAMQQNQTYQEKNYHIAWIASIREEMRDFLTIFIGRLHTSGVLNTLLFAVSTGFLCEGRLDDDAPAALAYAYYSSLIASMLYFGCSILFCFIGVARAYDESRKFLLKFVPDVPDSYQFDFLTQFLEWEGKSEAVRLPFVMEPGPLCRKVFE